jgi:hypothetical protein
MKYILTYFSLLLSTVIYSQCVSGNCLDGKGEFKSKEGLIYQTEWNQGRKNGFTTVIIPPSADFMNINDDTLKIKCNYYQDTLFGPAEIYFDSDEILEVYYNDVIGIRDFLLLKSKSEIISNQTVVPLTKRGNAYEISVKLNNSLIIDFLLDTGADEVFVSEDIVRTLIRTKTINEDDFLEGKEYTLADGSKVRSPRFIIRELAIGDFIFKDVEAAIGNMESSLLLGQNILKRFSKYEINNSRSIFIGTKQ